jgi:oxygen-independent coproporphyrinogen-3 oxidase
MCDLSVDVAAVCRAHGAPEDALDGELHDCEMLAAEGLCAVVGRRVTTRAPARRLVRAVAACFDANLPRTQLRHARAV